MPSLPDETGRDACIHTSSFDNLMLSIVLVVERSKESNQLTRLTENMGMFSANTELWVWQKHD